MRVPEKRIWHGSEEPIFDVLPSNVLANFRNARSENALLWNTIYKMARPAIQLGSLLTLKPLWGTRGHFEAPEDELTPFFWGYGVQGDRLWGLDEALLKMDGPGPVTEVDLFLLGDKHLIAVEAKHTTGFGRCGRFQQGRCPEIHPENAAEKTCRYWEEQQAKFENEIKMGRRPQVGSESPPCSRHYQLSRTFLLGKRLAVQHDRLFSLWAFAASKRWRSLELDWLEFTDRVHDSNVWRRMRVISWESLRR